MHFGMTWHDYRKVLCVGGCLALLLLAIGVPVGLTHDTLDTPGDFLRLFAQALFTGGVLPAFLAPGLLLGLRVDEETITQLVLGKERSTRPISALRELSLRSGTYAVVLTFRDGTHMRLLGCHRARRLALVERMEQQVPGLVVRHARWSEPEASEEHVRS